MSKLAKYLITDLNGDWSKPSIKFFRSSGAYGYIIWLTIINCYFEKENIPIEKLVNDVQKYASRRTILDFIDKAIINRTQKDVLTNISRNVSSFMKSRPLFAS